MKTAGKRELLAYPDSPATYFLSAWLSYPYYHLEKILPTYSSPAVHPRVENMGVKNL
jgi:hypothetical protein